ncbi:unnamed protein product [Mesocestoides corti]|uniref:SCP domain-containing protein n=1 Tax=Mesocestoides corti TaxID=53468 RepID=A0A158QSF8_MESCO|nr:unnamed protein product [Mesocestoides corti]
MRLLHFLKQKASVTFDKIHTEFVHCSKEQPSACWTHPGIQLATTVAELTNNYSVELEQMAERYLSRCLGKYPDPSVDTEFNGTAMMIKTYSPHKPTVLQYLQDVQSNAYLCDSQHLQFAFCQSYRKMLWAQSTEVGCAIHFCGLSGQSNYLVGCLYKPGLVILIACIAKCFFLSTLILIGKLVRP